MFLLKNRKMIEKRKKKTQFKRFLFFIFIFSLFFFYPHLNFGRKKSKPSRHCSKIIKIIGAKSFYITNKALKFKKVKKRSCIPLGASFELPPLVSIQLKLNSNSFIFINEKSSIRISKWNQNLLLKISTGVFKIHLTESKKQKSKKKKLNDIFIETTDLAALLKGPTKTPMHEYIFERTPSRTSLYSLKGFALVSENKNALKQKDYYSKLRSKEYTYGRLDQPMSFKKVRTLKKISSFLKRFYNKNPHFKKILN